MASTTATRAAPSTTRKAKPAGREIVMKKIVFVCLMSLPLTVLAQQGESLRIGAGDQIHVSVIDSPELDQHPRVTDAGEVPLLGVRAVKIAGLTPGYAATAIEAD